MAVPRITVDLSESPTRRWHQLAAYKTAGRQLLAAYADLPVTAALEAALDELERDHVDPEHVAELTGIAQILGVERGLVRLANYHYDGMKLVHLPAPFACTAVAIDHPQGPLHARNLDWFTSKGLLARTTLIVDVKGAPAGDFSLVTWPGFAGALSAVAPWRFAVTLNFVTSGEPFRPGAPVVFALRRVLEQCASFESAVETLSSLPLISDALLLLTGCRPQDRVIIERTPTRVAKRRALPGDVLAATNDYRSLSPKVHEHGALSETSCSRYDRALALSPGVTDFERAFAMLEDDAVRMDITVQHMVMQAATGHLDVRLPVAFRETRGGWSRLLDRIFGRRGHRETR